jgi:hypothetical protein
VARWQDSRMAGGVSLNMVYKFTSLQVYKFTGLQVYRFTSLQVYRFRSGVSLNMVDRF